MRKKIVICLITFLLAFSLVACGDQDETTTANTQTDADDPTESGVEGDVYTDANGDPWSPWV